ncbi:MAG: membrane protein insertion efficiency factor YidD [bacterium]
MVKFALTLLILCASAFAGDSLAVPDTSASKPAENVVKASVKSLFTVYEKGITVTETHNCPMSPNCSRFAKVAIEEAGLIKGILLTADRLLRDNNFAHRYYPEDQNGKLTDPVERYTQWKKPQRP